MSTQTADIAARLADIPTASISDAMDFLGIEGALHGITPLTYGFRAAGRAFTVQYAPADEERGSVGDFLDDVPAGSVIVIDNQGRTDVTVWGGIMTEVAAARGISGTVINGVCRDVAASLTQNYPIFSQGRYMRTGKDRVRLVSVGAELVINNIRIAPGAIICADADGAFVVPANVAEKVAELAEGIEATETRIVDTVKAGSTLKEARAQLGYHDLQWKKA